MKRLATPIFKVEVKRGSRPQRNWVQVAEDRASKQVPAGSSASAPRPQAAPPVAVATAAVQGARILPDLLSVQALEDRTREEFEQKAAEAQTAGRPSVKKSRSPAIARRVTPREVTPDIEEASARKTAPSSPSAARDPATDRDAPRAAAVRVPHPEDGITAPDATSVVRTRGVLSEADRRSAKRRGEKVVLKPGERWKRRLPRVCW